MVTAVTRQVFQLFLLRHDFEHPQVSARLEAVDEILDEVTHARNTERGATRADDRFSDAAMEDRKKEGYF